MKGIPFSPEMALALREGRKSETRRVIKHPILTTLNEFDEYDGSGTIEDGSFVWHTVPKSGSRICVKPKYNVGDVCFVQESWAKVPRTAFWHDQSIPHVDYIDETGFAWWSVFKDDWDRSPLSWKSPRFMPAWAARTFVQVTSVRVERVGQITEEAAVREGMRQRSRLPGLEPRQGPCSECGRHYWEHPGGNCYQTSYHNLTFRGSFAHLWNRLHPKAPYRFEDDPWVWVHGLKEVPRP